MSDSSFSLRRWTAPLTPKRVICMLLGHIPMSLGIAIFAWAWVGNLPFPAINLALTHYVPLSYGTVVLLVNVLLFLVEWLLAANTFIWGLFLTGFSAGILWISFPSCSKTCPVPRGLDGRSCSA